MDKPQPRTRYESDLFARPDHPRWIGNNFTPPKDANDYRWPSLWSDRLVPLGPGTKMMLGLIVASVVVSVLAALDWLWAA